MFKSIRLSQIYSLLALGLFAAAVFLIADGHFWIGIVLIGAGAIFTSAAGIQKKKTAGDFREKYIEVK